MFLIYYTSKLSNEFNPVMSAPNEKLADEWIENNKEKYPKLLKKMKKFTISKSTKCL